MSEQMAKITNIGMIRLTGPPTSIEYQAKLEGGLQKNTDLAQYRDLWKHEFHTCHWVCLCLQSPALNLGL